MSVIKLCKILLLSFSLVFVILFPLTTFAMVATPSDVMKVSVSTSSNASPIDDYVDADEFDTIDSPVLLSSGDDSDYNVKWHYVAVWSGTDTRYTAGYLGSDGFYHFSSPGAGYRIVQFRLYIHRAGLPSAGTYGLSVNIAQGNIDADISASYIQFDVGGTNVETDYRSVYLTNANANNGTSYVGNCNVTIPSNCKSLSYAFSLKNPTTAFDLGGCDYKFTLNSNSGPSVSGGDIDNTQDMTNNTNQIANNTAQQVEQGDTIIELIKNTIQTISSQLTAFWNQLAGEFTNLYDKMNQQHQESITKVDEQIDNDNTNTDKVTTAIESHGNFIIEGLKKLFIPSDEYFKAYFDDLYSWFSERFGFLSFPIDLLLEVIDIFVNSSQTDCVLVLPSFTIMENLLWPEMSFNLTVFLNTNFSFVVVAIKTVTSIYLVMAFVQLCEEKWNEVMMN